MNKENEEMWNHAWFLTRVILGWFIHAVLIVFALFNIEVMYEAAKGFYMNHADAPLFSAQAVGVIMSASFFTAAMAGAYWVKQMYIRYALPEIMDEMTKKLIRK